MLKLFSYFHQNIGTHYYVFIYVRVCHIYTPTLHMHAITYRCLGECVPQIKKWEENFAQTFISIPLLFLQICAMWSVVYTWVCVLQYMFFLQHKYFGTYWCYNNKYILWEKKLSLNSNSKNHHIWFEKHRVCKKKSFSFFFSFLCNVCVHWRKDIRQYVDDMKQISSITCTIVSSTARSSYYWIVHMVIPSSECSNLSFFCS